MYIDFAAFPWWLWVFLAVAIPVNLIVYYYALTYPGGLAYFIWDHWHGVDRRPR